MRKAAVLQKKLISDEVRQMACFFFFFKLLYLYGVIYYIYFILSQHHDKENHHLHRTVQMITECFVILINRLSVCVKMKSNFCQRASTNQNPHNLLKIIAINEECQTLMFLFLRRVHHSDTLQVHSTGTLIQRKAFRPLAGSQTTVAERWQHNQMKSGPSQ